MTAKKKLANAKPAPACPVKGCKAKTPHTADPVVKSLVDQFNRADKLLDWVLSSLTEIRNSIIDDVEHHRHFAWITRLRQVEELYYRALYLLFVAPGGAVPHVISCDPPNSFTQIYDEVNQKLLQNGGAFTSQSLHGAGFGTPMEWLHGSGHADYKTMRIVSFLQAAGSDRVRNIVQFEEVFRHIDAHIRRTGQMREMFATGRKKKDVRKKIIQLHQQ
jgi:hypothetical protein